MGVKKSKRRANQEPAAGFNWIEQVLRKYHGERLNTSRTEQPVASGARVREFDYWNVGVLIILIEKRWNRYGEWEGFEAYVPVSHSNNITITCNDLNMYLGQHSNVSIVEDYS